MEALSQTVSGAWAASVQNLDQVTLLTPEQALVATVLVITGLALFVVGLWLRPGRRVGTTVVASLMIPMALAMVLRASTGFSGTPDDNCAKYDDGKAVFSILQFARIPGDARDPYGQGWLILIVRSEKHWGNEPHQCRLSFANQKTREISLLLPNMCEVDGASSGSWSRGLLTLSLGTVNEKPNVTFPKLDPEDEKRGPPEAPPRGRTL